MRFVFIREFFVEKIEEHESYDLIPDTHQFQKVIAIEDFAREPKVGWKYEAGICFPDLPDITPRQCRQALILSGVSMDAIHDALDGLPEPTRSLALTEWEYSIAFKRRRPLVMSVAMTLGWTEDQLDDLWVFASKL
jgi:hypothetical protein